MKTLLAIILIISSIILSLAGLFVWVPGNLSKVYDAKADFSTIDYYVNSQDFEYNLYKGVQPRLDILKGEEVATFLLFKYNTQTINSIFAGWQEVNEREDGSVSILPPLSTCKTLLIRVNAELADYYDLFTDYDPSSNKVQRNTVADSIICINE